MSYFDRNGRYLGISSKKNLTSPKKSAKFKGKKFESSKQPLRRKKMREQSNYYEGDLSELGIRENLILSDLLKMWAEGKMTKNAADVFDSLKAFGFNASSGNVFLIDDNYNVLMDAGGELDLFISLPYSGEEGFPYEFEGRDKGEFNSEDVEYLESLGIELAGEEPEPEEEY